MTSRTLFGGCLAFALVVLGAGLGACGQDAATCDSVCALPDAPTPNSTCTSGCTTGQSECVSAGYGGTFQQLLTCIENAGTYVSATELCASQTAAIQSECSTSTGIQSSSGGTGSSSGGSSGTCAELGSCCSMLAVASEVTSCEAVASANVQDSCSAALGSIQSQGFCSQASAGH